MPYGKHENPEVALIEQSVYQINRIIFFWLMILAYTCYIS